eukprot:1153932-Pelagomonas_calceolata.AAC.4
MPLVCTQLTRLSHAAIHAGVGGRRSGFSTVGGNQDSIRMAGGIRRLCCASRSSLSTAVLTSLLPKGFATSS